MLVLTVHVCLPVSTWMQITGYPTSIASLAFTPDGSLLAVASSYMFEHGEQKQQQPDQIYIRLVQEAEVKPKPRKVAH